MIHDDVKLLYSLSRTGYHGSSAGKESCNAVDPSSIPGVRRFPGEGVGYPFQYSWASLVAQTVKNQPAMRRPGFDPWVGKSPGEGNDNPLQNFCLETSMDIGAWRATVHGVAKSQT